MSAKAVYSVVVENVGTTWTGDRFAEALREFKAAAASAAQPGGRDGWEPVTLMRNGDVVREFTPGPFWFIEVTDTFGGEANYSWARRFKVYGKTERHALRRWSPHEGYAGRLRCVDRTCNYLRYDVRGAAICVFVSEWTEDCDDYLHVVEV